MFCEVYVCGLVGFFFNCSKTSFWQPPTTKKVGRGWGGVWNISETQPGAQEEFICKPTHPLLQGRQERSWKEVLGFAVPAAHTLSKGYAGCEAEWRLGADPSLWHVKALLDIQQCFLSQHFGFG